MFAKTNRKICRETNHFPPFWAIRNFRTKKGNVPFIDTLLAEETSALEGRDLAKIRIYRTPQERREAGIGTQLTPWLKFSGLIEIEKEFLETKQTNSIDTSGSGRPSQTIQLGFDITATEWLEVEIVYEIENDKTKYTKLDEAAISADLKNWGIKIGPQYLPYGEFYSHFVTSPMIEFGESREPSLIVDYSLNDNIEITTFLFRSDYNQSIDRDLDWGMSIEIKTSDEAMQLGTSFISDLAETQDALLEVTDNIYQNRVWGWSAYALLGFSNFEVTAEMLRAQSEFLDLDDNANKPTAYNFEIAYFPIESIQLAFRIEHSKELSDNPEWKYGIAASWRFARKFNFSIDYLRASYKSNFVFDDNDNELDSSQQIGAQFALEF